MPITNIKLNENGVLVGHYNNDPDDCEYDIGFVSVYYYPHFSLENISIRMFLKCDDTDGILKTLTDGVQLRSSIDGSYKWSTNKYSLGSPAVGAVYIDDSENLYLAGPRIKNYTVRKYNSSKVLQWSYNTENSVYGIIVDSSGNVLCVGQPENHSGSHYSIFKLNSSGVLQWRVAYGQVNRVVTDSLGNVYCIGPRSLRSGVYCTVFKLNSSGVFQWGYDVGSTQMLDLGIDSNANIYFVEYGSTDPNVWKLNSLGVFQWSFYTHSYARSITVDSDDNIYIGCSSSTDTTYNKDTLFKLNSAGVLQYHSRTTQTIYSISVDSSGEEDSLWVGLYTLSDSSYKTKSLAKINMDDGSEICSVNLTSVLHVNANQEKLLLFCAAPSPTYEIYNSSFVQQYESRSFYNVRGVKSYSSYVYLHGYGIYIYKKDDTNLSDISLIKLNGVSKEYIWFLTTSVVSDVFDVFVDSSENIYVVGARTSDKTVWKLNSSGEVQWSYDIVNGIARKVVVDSSGNVYIAGERNYSNKSVWKLNSSGVLQWSYDTGNKTYGIDVDSSGNIYIAGNYVSEYDAEEEKWHYYNIWKLNSSGVLQWKYESAGSSGNAYQATVDSSGSILFGLSANAIDDYDIIKLNSAGVLQWGYEVIDGNGGSFVVDLSDNIFIGVQSNYANNTVLKLNSSGVLQSTLATKRVVVNISMNPTTEEIFVK